MLLPLKSDHIGHDVLVQHNKGPKKHCPQVYKGNINTT